MMENGDFYWARNPDFGPKSWFMVLIVDRTNGERQYIHAFKEYFEIDPEQEMYQPLPEHWELKKIERPFVSSLETGS